MRGYRPTVSQKEEVWAHCTSKGGTEAGQSVNSSWRGWCPMCKKMREYRPTMS